jgi:hypothetical protein
MNHHLLLLRLVLAAVLMMNLPAAGGVDLLARPLETSWKPFSADPATKLADVWQVKDGVLVCKGHPLGGIYLDRDLADFTLRLEWRWPAESETGKGGVLLRAAAPWKIWPRSLEAQLNVGQAGDFWGLGGFSLAGPEDRLKRLDHPEFGKLTNLERTATAEKPPGEWNQYEIVAAGPVVTLKVNGKLVNRTSNCDRHPGKICLTSEGNEIQFRNIRLFTTAADATRAEPAPAAPGGTLETGFINPPSSARPHVFWTWMNGNITREGITADLEANFFFGPHFRSGHVHQSSAKIIVLNAQASHSLGGI